jgi:hypothetical protein
MIIVQLKGGLGNQLFQYAAGLSLARHHGVPVKVDVNELKQPDELIGTLRNYELQHLLAPPQIANPQEIHSLTKSNVIINYFRKTLPSFRRIIYNEKRFEFDPNFFKAGKNIYLKGYRQSEKYFHSISKEIHATFQLKPTLTGNIADFANAINKKESVSVHIRRGDYNNSAVNDYHGIASESYYQQAIDRLICSLENPSFYVFSDNIDWIKQNLQFAGQVEFVSGSISKTHYEDFYLMSRCKHNIIANSSFSWWAAWLNSNPDKKIIAPLKWFNNAPYNTSDLIPKDWIRL